MGLATLKSRLTSTVGLIVLLALAYVIFGKLGLLLAIPPGFATAIFPPVGIALAAVLIWGRSLLVGVFLGSTLLNVLISVDDVSAITWQNFLIASGIASGTTLQCFVASYLIKRWVGFPNPLVEERSIVKIFIIGGPLACVISAFIGSMVLYSAGIIDATTLHFSMWTWWVGDSIGVLIALPLMLILFASPRKLWWSRLNTVGLPLIAGVLVVIIIFIRSSEIQQGVQKQSFYEKSTLIKHKLELRLSQYSQVVKFMDQISYSRSHEGRKNFNSFALPIIKDYPDIIALSWNEYIVDSERATFEQKMKHVHGDLYEIKIRNSQGKLVTSLPAKAYAPVTFIEPYNYNAKVLGFNPMSDDLRKVAFQIEGKASEPLISKLINPVQNVDRKAFLLVQAVYDRRRVDLPLLGFAVAVISPSEIISYIFQGLNRSDYLLELYDSSGGQNQLIYADKKNLSDYAQTLKWSGSIKFGGHIWKINLTPSNSYIKRGESLQAWVVLAGGLLICVFLGIFLLILSGRAELVRQHVRQKTIELSEILENAADGIIIFSDSGVVELANPVAEDIFNFNLDANKNINITDFLPILSPISAENLGQYYGKNCEVIGKTIHDELVEIEMALSFYEISERKRYICLVRNISDRKQIDRIKNEFVATVSHELRTPLTSIKGSLALVESGVVGAVNPEASELVKIALSNTDRLAALVDDLLDLERLKHAETSMHIEYIDIAEVLRESISHSLGYAYKFNINLKLNLEKLNGPTIVAVDRLRMQQIMANLLSNAIKFSPKYSSVQVSAEVYEGMLRVNVVDQGPGISEAFRSRLFERFAQADSSDRRQQGGTGLGLHICKTLITRMNGEIGCDSVFGQGCTFFICLPVVTPE